VGRVFKRIMNVLVIGGGGREHALCWKLAASPLLDRLFCAPGNPGIAQVATCVSLDVSDAQAVIAFCRSEKIDLVVIGPEQPLVDGLADQLKAAGVACFGPSAAAARLEGSKAFTKEFCARHAIPTAAFARFTDEAAAFAYLEQVGAPIVVKADGLAAGKGVVVAQTLEAARAAVSDCLGGRFGPAGAEVVIEEYMVGEEVSFFALVDGQTALPLIGAQDHKRVGDSDTGPNTGGMGAYSPAPVFTAELQNQVMREIIAPTVAGLAAEGMPYVGVLFAGLMITAQGPRLIEYNCRFGDPECQTLMLRLQSDLLTALVAATEGGLKHFDLRWSAETALCVVLAAKGYPGEPAKGGTIAGLEAAAAVPGVLVFHAGTTLTDGQLRASGGRVLNVCAVGKDAAEARARAYQAIERISWTDGFCRRDIGWRALDRA
jgi:phosphoribosylamine---glycine ligase